MKIMTDSEWVELVRDGQDAGWKRIWEEVVEPESRSMRSATMMRDYSIDVGDLMSWLYSDMIGRDKISLYRGSGSFAGWLRTYVRGYILNADPNRHGEISIEGAHQDGKGESESLVIPKEDPETIRAETWRMTHWCFRKLWNEDPVRCYVHILKTKFFLSSEEIREFLDLSSAANVDQIFSRSVKFMRNLASRF